MTMILSSARREKEWVEMTNKETETGKEYKFKAYCYVCKKEVEHTYKEGAVTVISCKDCVDRFNGVHLEPEVITP